MTDERALHEQVKDLEMEVRTLRSLAEDRGKMIDNIRADVMEFTVAQPTMPLRDTIRYIRRKVEEEQAAKNARIDQLLTTANLHSATIQRKQDVIDALEEEKRRQTKSIADLMLERDELHRRLVDAVLPENTAMVSEENATLVTELSEAQEKVRLMDDQNASLRLELSRLRADYQGRSNHIDHLQGIITKRNGEIQDLKNEFGLHEQKISDLERTIRDGDLVEVARLRELLLDKERARQALWDRFTQLLGECDAQKRDYADLESKHRTQVDAIQVLQSTNRTLQADIGRLQADIRSLRADEARYRDTIVSIKAEANGLRLDIRRLQREVAEKVERIQALQTDISNFLSDGTRYQHTIATLRSQMEGLEADIRNLGGDEDHIPDQSDLEELDAHRNFVSDLDGVRQILRDQIGN